MPTEALATLWMASATPAPGIIARSLTVSGLTASVTRVQRVNIGQGLAGICQTNLIPKYRKILKGGLRGAFFIFGNGNFWPNPMGWTPPPLNGIQVPDWNCYPPVTREKQSTMNKPGRVGIDLAKNIFQLHGMDRHGKAVCRRRVKSGSKYYWRK
jgi:hypothetical protein